MNVPRVRTIGETAKFIREQDPETAITEYCLRQWCIDGTIPYAKAGTKYLVNLDAVINLVNTLKETTV